MRHMTLSLLALALAAGDAPAAEQHRELGPHKHGHGTLNMAIEKNRLSMDLDVPGMDVVGFEHTASTPEQKATVEKSEALLAQPLVLFKVPASAGCKVIEAKVAIEAEGEHEHDEQDPASEAKDATAMAAGKTGGEPDTHEGHNDYNVTYVLDCAAPSQITSIAFDYFKSFEGAKALTVNVVSEKAQTTFEVTREMPIVDLGGMM